MIRPPLFGKDSSPQYTAPRLSCLCTVVICLIFILLMFIITGTKTKKFSEPIRIVLDPLPVQKAQKISEDVPNSLSSNVKSEITNSKPEPSVQESQTPIQNYISKNSNTS